MHQPLYKDRLSGLYLMPWVRLHAIKDYLDMPLALEPFPGIRQTFNLVPSLLEQIEDYAEHGAVDQQIVWLTREKEEFSDDEKAQILAESFHCNLERQIKQFAPYFDLWMKRERLQKKGDAIAKLIDEFSVQEYLDMMTWMNIAWFDPYWRRQYAEVQQLVSQGGNFTLAQRKRLIEIEREICRQTIPVYKRLQDSGQIEVTTTPYYHPILPLLIDTNTARLPAPHTPLPKRLFFHREDARAQLEKGVDLYKRMFGRPPRGMWPSEMSISPAALELISQSGIKWVVADEALLCRTNDVGINRDQHGNLNSAELLCQPYNIRIGDNNITVLFREVVTSNEIGFSYGGRDAEEAATALYMRLKHIQQRLFHWHREGVVAIALDGENCWETYEQDGHPFLRELYERISKDNTLNVCTVSEYLERNPPTAELSNIHSGSWIGADFHIWIGDPHKNLAWDMLSEARDFLVDTLAAGKFSEDVQKRAWEEIYAAEGSDWFWWFGEPNNSAQDAMFDEQFRLRLQNVYKLLGKPHPKELETSVYDLVARKSAAKTVDLTSV
jgi:alpha-amylase/alpha-mannosidase (GH57 family)